MKLIPSQLILTCILVCPVLLALSTINYSKKPIEREATTVSYIPNMNIELCSGKTLDSGKCTGSAYCTACTNCKYCKHCNNGGACGVCGKRPATRKSDYYNPPSSSSRKKPAKKAPIKKQTPEYVPSTNHASSSTSTEGIAVQPVYIVTLKTSLRQLPDSKAKVILRFKEGDEVVVIDNTGKWWSKVSFKGNIGWVKKGLLKKSSSLRFP